LEPYPAPGRRIRKRESIMIGPDQLRYFFLSIRFVGIESIRLLRSREESNADGNSTHEKAVACSSRVLPCNRSCCGPGLHIASVRWRYAGDLQGRGSPERSHL